MSPSRTPTTTPTTEAKRRGVRPSDRALAEAARAALARFDVPRSAAIARLHDGENTTWKVLQPGREPVVLRLHRAGYQPPRRIEGELAWLDQLAQDLPDSAPRPVRDRAGAWLHEIAVPRSDQVRPATLLTWTRGRFSAWPGSPNALRSIGVLAAGLHRQSHAWRSPYKRRRPALGFEEHVGERCLWGIAPVALPGLRRTQRERLTATLRELRRRIVAWEGGRRQRGLIHADLHLANALVDGGVARAIDFDDCARTWFLMDPAVTLMSAALSDGYERRRAAFWEGYAAGGGVIPASDWPLLATFQLVRLISMAAWSWSRSDHPGVRARHPRRIALMLDACRVWQRTDGARIR